MHSENRSLTWVAYGVAFALTALALTEVLITAWPMQAGSARWRVATFGLVANTLTFCVLGMLIAALAARALEHKWVLRTIAGVGLLSGLIVGGATLLFLLDALQLRRLVTQGTTRSYDLVAAKAALAGGLSALLLIWLGTASWLTAAPRRSRRPARARGGTLLPKRTAPVADAGTVAGAAGRFELSQ